MELRRSKRRRIEKNLKSFFTFLVEGEPKTYKEGMLSLDAPFWKEAINDEYETILQNNTRVLSNLPPGDKPIGCKWVLGRNSNQMGELINTKLD